jgi:hypothetical protein
MKFKLQIELGNAEMRTSHHLSRALYEVLEKITAGNLVPKAEREKLPVDGIISDNNGNRVGSWELTKE